MSVKRFSRILDAMNYGNKSLRAVIKSAPTPMAHALQECLNHFETIALMAKESLEHAKRHKKKVLETRM